MMNYPKIILTICCCIVAVAVQGQYENVWAFGDKAGLDFNTLPPTPIQTSIDTREGSASICDENGELLFYTDGFSVWNKEHNIMPNGQDLTHSGVSISASTTQGTLIVPKPGSISQYYIFSLGAREANAYRGRLYYSIVDMDLNSGLGDIVTSAKGVLLDSLLSEHLTAVPGPDCNVWLLCVSFASFTDNTLNAYEIDINGIDHHPVTSPLTMGGGAYQGFIGSIATSTNFQKLAITRGNLVLYDFDRNSGVINNALVLVEDPLAECYSACFSADNSKLYTSSRAGLIQFDLSFNAPNLILTSKTVIADVFASIRKAEDGKIYCSNEGGINLHVIHRPSLAGTACGFEEDALSLHPGTESLLGLPNSVVHRPVRLQTTVMDTTVCKADSFTLYAGIANGSNYRWNDGFDGPVNSFLTSGTYWVRYNVFDWAGCYTVVDTFHIEKVAPWDLLTQDTVVCKGDTLAIEATGGEGYTYQWSPAMGLSNPSVLAPYIIATESQTYTLSATHPKCADTSQSFTLTVDTPYQVRFTVDPRAVCVGRPVYLYPTSPDASATGLQWTVSEAISREETTWSRQYQHAFDQAGTFPVSLTMTFRACPESEYTDSITVYPLPEVDLGGDSTICLHGAPVYLKNLREAPLNPHRYLWSTGDTTATLKVVHPGTYTLSITTEPLGCTTTESIEISKDCYIDMPNAFSPNGDGNNDYFFPRQLLSKSISRFRMQVFNRWGQLIFDTTNPDGRGWDGRFNDNMQPMGVYLYRIEAEFRHGHREIYEGNVTLIR